MGGRFCGSKQGLEMRRSALIAAALLSIAGFVGPASAADLAARPYTKAPPAPAGFYNWTGFYIGANGGYGWGSASSYAIPGGIPTSHDPSGGLAGGQIGYNWQTGPWVYGLEADGDWANIRGSALCPVPVASCASDTRALASFRGRLGWATGPVLLYGTGGFGTPTPDLARCRSRADCPPLAPPVHTPLIVGATRPAPESNMASLRIGARSSNTCIMDLAR